MPFEGPMPVTLPEVKKPEPRIEELEVVSGALRLLTKDRWMRGELYGSGGRVCAIGALKKSAAEMGLSVRQQWELSNLRVDAFLMNPLLMPNIWLVNDIFGYRAVRALLRCAQLRYFLVDRGLRLLGRRRS